MLIFQRKLSSKKNCIWNCVLESLGHTFFNTQAHESSGGSNKWLMASSKSLRHQGVVKHWQLPHMKNLCNFASCFDTPSNAVKAEHHSNQAFADSQHSTGTFPNEVQHHSAGVHNIGIYGMSSKASIFQCVSKIIKLNQHSIGNHEQMADLLILVQEQIKVPHTVYSLSTKSHREEWRNIGRFQK